MAPNRKRSSKRSSKRVKDIRVEAIDMIMLSYDDCRYQDALDGLLLLKSIDDSQKWKQIIDDLIQSCRKKVEIEEMCRRFVDHASAINPNVDSSSMLKEIMMANGI